MRPRGGASTTGAASTSTTPSPGRALSAEGDPARKRAGIRARGNERAWPHPGAARRYREGAGVRYVLDHRVIDAADVGAPQHRSRAIVIASQVRGKLPWPEEVEPTTAWDAIGALQQHEDELPKPKGKWAELLPSIPEGENYLWHTDRGGGEPLFGWRTRYWSFLLKLAKDRPSWSLPAQPGPANGPFHWDNRPLSIPEMLRLQTFPVDWVVEGSARTDHVRQMGNATPPLLAEAWPLRRRAPHGRRTDRTLVHGDRAEESHPSHASGQTGRRQVPTPHQRSPRPSRTRARSRAPAEYQLTVIRDRGPQIRVSGPPK